MASETEQAPAEQQEAKTETEGGVEEQQPIEDRIESVQDEAETEMDDLENKIDDLKENIKQVEEFGMDNVVEQYREDLADLQGELEEKQAKLEGLEGGERSAEEGETNNIESVIEQLDDTLNSTPDSFDDFFENRESIYDLQGELASKERELTDTVVDEFKSELPFEYPIDSDEEEQNLEKFNEAYSQWKENGAAPDGLDIDAGMLKKSHERLKKIQQAEESIDMRAYQKRFAEKKYQKLQSEEPGINPDQLPDQIVVLAKQEDWPISKNEAFASRAEAVKENMNQLIDELQEGYKIYDETGEMKDEDKLMSNMDTLDALNMVQGNDVLVTGGAIRSHLNNEKYSHAGFEARGKMDRKGSVIANANSMDMDRIKKNIDKI